MSKQYVTISINGVILALAVTFSAPTKADINQGTHLNTGGQAKVNKALARGYQQSADTDGYTRMQQQSQVNIGSKKAGTCNMNIGSTQPGQRNSKEVIVTSKEIINVCK